jgi:CHASE2 domain-containing sensor protein/predicted Ser/Thr protein kinase
MSVNEFTVDRSLRAVTPPANRGTSFVYTRAALLNGVFVASRLARLSWLPGGLAAAVVIAIGQLVTPSPFAPLEFAGYDRAQRASSFAVDDIVLVDVDQQSLSEIGPWPWPRSTHADLLARLASSGAKVVAFTSSLGETQPARETEKLRAALSLLESSNLGTSQQADNLRSLLKASENDPDAQLAAAITVHRNVVLPVEVRPQDASEEVASVPSRMFASAASSATSAGERVSIVRPIAATLGQVVQGVGHEEITADSDGVVRTDAAGVRVGSAVLPSLAVAIAARALDIDPQQISFGSPDSLRLGSHTVTLDGALRMRPSFIRPDGIKHLSYARVLAGEIPDSDLRDKIVLVGLAESESAFATPVGTAASPQTIIASSVASLLHDRTYSHPGSAVMTQWLVAVGIILFAAFVLPAAGPGLGALATVLVAAIAVIVDIGLLGSMHQWMQLVTPAVAAVAGFVFYLLSELIRRANVKAADAKDPTANLRTLGQTFQRQGQLDLAFETYRRCPLDAPTMELLYYLGLDFERRRQNQKAIAVYNHIATRDPNYRDLRVRRTRVAEPPATREIAEKPKTRSIPPVPAPRYERPRDDWSEEPIAEPASLGRKLGRYELERELGKGAMGVVYLGRDPNINRVVAIKAIPLADEFEESDLEEARARFFREAEMAGRLNHPSIVTVYDAGEDQGLAYIAMEYLRGHHLSHHTDASRLLPPRTVMTLVARVAEALDYAHRQNVVHRDIKPANIMFNPESDELKITDFGIARLTDTSRTKTGIVLGTPSFMSPEQLEGRNLDGRSDQFALGVSLYHLLTGQLPFRAESMPRLMQKIATEPHTPIRMVRPELPEAIDAIVDRALAKSADERYPNCGQFAADLRACAKTLEPQKSATEHEWLLP